MGEAGGGGEKGVTHPKSGCGSDWITHNSPLQEVNTSSGRETEATERFFIDRSIL